MSLVPPPLSIYVHLPWCVRKCPYCDFNSHVAPPDLPQARYVDCLLEDFEYDLHAVGGRDVQSIFFGGGTPSLFAPEQIARVIDGLGSRANFASAIEITMEANPGTIEHGRFSEYRSAGVTRVSVGVQSFDDVQLQRLGRIHSASHVHNAVDEVRAAGFDNFNLDLMYGLPEQTIEGALQDLAYAIELKPTHLSHYQLTLEPGTVFYHRPPPLPDDETTWQMQERCQERLAAAGYGQYEVSAYAQSNYQCRHNLNYWQFGDYIGIGAGAHGKLTSTEEGGVLRTVRLKQPREYLAGSVSQRLIERQLVPQGELPFEYMLNALRLNRGFDVTDFEKRTGLTAEVLAPALRRAENLQLVQSSGSLFVPTERGHRFLTDLQGLFLGQTT